MSRAADTTYVPIGCTHGRFPATGYWLDEARTTLGHGRELYETACGIVMHGEHFPAPMTRLFSITRPLALGDVVLAVYRLPLWGGWFSMPARVTEVFRDVCDTPAGRIHRGGFTYGTLPGHIESGEERFLVEWNEEDDAVTYTITSDSRPQWWPVWLGLPVARWEQARFRRLAMARIRAIIRGADIPVCQEPSSPRQTEMSARRFTSSTAP